MTRKVKFWHAGGGAMRARRDLDDHRTAQTERLKDADPQPNSRQVKRAWQRRKTKMPIGMTMKNWHRQNWYPV